MNEWLTKLSSYNLFNYLLPGVVFVVLSADVVHYPIDQRDIVTALFLYYFVGLVVSRFGSIIVEPLLKWLSFLRFADYKKFVVAEEKDEKLGLLSEANNTYRTFCSLFILLLLLHVYLMAETRFLSIRGWNKTLLIVLLLILFLFSYRKQTAYIAQRIKAREYTSGR